MRIDRLFHFPRGKDSRVLAACLSMGLMMSPLFAGAHGPEIAVPPATRIDEAAKPAVAVVDRFSAALKAGDMERAGSLLADHVLILESGGVEYSREEYLGGHAVHDAAFLKDAHVQIKQRTARSSGDMAWVGTESELHASKEGKPLTLRSTETMVLQRDHGTWRIMHIHWSSRPVKVGANPQS